MKIIGLSGPSRHTGMTLMETLVSMMILAIVISATINGYILSTNRADWSSQSLAAHSLALQRLEQVRAATWRTGGEADIDEVTAANFPIVNSVLDLPVSGTNVVTATIRTNHHRRFGKSAAENGACGLRLAVSEPRPVHQHDHHLPSRRTTMNRSCRRDCSASHAAVQRSSLAYTLTEIMVTMAIVVMVLAAMISCHLLGLKLFELTKAKLGASDDARRSIGLMISEIRSAKFVRVGSGDLADFKEVDVNTPHVGNAMQVYPSTNTNFWVTVLFGFIGPKAKARDERRLRGRCHCQFQSATRWFSPPKTSPASHCSIMPSYTSSV